LKLVHLEKVSAKKIRDLDGKLAGRLEEVHADWQGDECVVTHYTIAPRGTFVLRQMGFMQVSAYVVPWDRMDFTDPDKPKLKCRISELTRTKTV
jgi:sporulation protein YlmC with PRC-barrel domain